MTLDALIFVALAAAWIAYLLPKALQHHETVQRSRSVERFSHRMRVLARREPTSVREARLVVTPGRAPSRPVIETKGAAPVVSRAADRRAAANAAARRRRNVLSGIVLVLVVVAALAAAGMFSAWFVAVPGALLAAWLVACRLMVRRERGITATSRPQAQAAVTADHDDAETEFNLPPVKDTPAATSAREPEALDPDDPSRWDMVPVTLPTYVSKSPAERRTVQTIDLDSTGVWSSGRNEIDSALARTAQEIKKSEAAEAAAAEDAAQRRAVGH